MKVIPAYRNDEDENSKIVTMHFNTLTSLVQKRRPIGCAYSKPSHVQGTL